MSKLKYGTNNNNNNKDPRNPRKASKEACHPREFSNECHVKASKFLKVDGLACSTSEEQILKKFGRYGDIIDVSIYASVKYPGSSEALVEFCDITSVVEALGDRKLVILNHNIRLSFGKSTVTNCLWLNEIPHKIDAETLRNTFLKIGKVTDIVSDSPLKRALIYFESSKYSKAAYDAVKLGKLFRSPVQVDFANYECQTLFKSRVPESSPWNRYSVLESEIVHESPKFVKPVKTFADHSFVSNSKFSDSTPSPIGTDEIAVPSHGDRENYYGVSSRKRKHNCGSSKTVHDNGSVRFLKPGKFSTESYGHQLNDQDALFSCESMYDKVKRRKQVSTSCGNSLHSKQMPSSSKSTFREDRAYYALALDSEDDQPLLRNEESYDVPTPCTLPMDGDPDDTDFLDHLESNSSQILKYVSPPHASHHALLDNLESGINQVECSPNCPDELSATVFSQDSNSISSVGTSKITPTLIQSCEVYDLLNPPCIEMVHIVDYVSPLTVKLVVHHHEIKHNLHAPIIPESAKVEVAAAPCFPEKKVTKKRRFTRPISDSLLRTIDEVASGNFDAEYHLQTLLSAKSNKRLGNALISSTPRRTCYDDAFTGQENNAALADGFQSMCCSHVSDSLKFHTSADSGKPSSPASSLLGPTTSPSLNMSSVTALNPLPIISPFVAFPRNHCDEISNCSSVSLLSASATPTGFSSLLPHFAMSNMNGEASCYLGVDNTADVSSCSSYTSTSACASSKLEMECVKAWTGKLSLKNEECTINMHYVAGNVHVLQACLSISYLFPVDGTESGVIPPLKIVQRMRLENSQLEGVRIKMNLSSEHCTCVAVAHGRNSFEKLQMNISLTNNFIRYMLEKCAAGIINVYDHQTQQGAYVVHIFPPCDFSNQHLSTSVPHLYEDLKSNKIPHLLIVITTV